MNNFIMHNPVKLHFGKGVLENLPNSLAPFGKKVMLVYGRNSIKNSGLYDLIKSLLTDFEVFEFAGIKSNPLVQDADAAAEICKKNQIEMVLAVGGGSVIDSGKMIALGAKSDCGIWEFMTRKQKPNAALPIISVLTLAATGTEMNMFAVLQDLDSEQKLGFGNPLIYPKESFLDPSLTFSVPANYTAFGISDLIAHSLEGYFGIGEANLSDKIVLGILKEAVEFGELLLDNPTDYNLRARMMYASTIALNGMTNYGRTYGDWGVHALGHGLSLLFDTPHGASLSAVYPAWMRFFKADIHQKLENMGSEVFGVYSADEAIDALENFFAKIGTPTNLKDLELTEIQIQKLLKYWNQYKPSGQARILKVGDYEKLVEMMK